LLSEFRGGRAQSVSQEEAHVPRPFVLIADAHGDTRELYTVYLRSRGCRVAQARSGCEALKKAVRLRPDVLLTEVVLPAVDGLELCRRVRSNPRTRSTAVVTVTADVRQNVVDQALAAGSDLVLFKPCLIDWLWQQMQALLARREASLAAAAPTAPP
jgi:two-component system, cell cycle response regulator DivK